MGEEDQTRAELEALRSENAALKNKLEESTLTHDEYHRYGRQMIVPQMTFQGQVKLKQSRILVIGAGGLGCPALMYLAGAGVGKIGVVDGDVVDESNLHRQVMHTTELVGQLKVESARQFISGLNPHVEVHTYPFRLSASNAFDIFQHYDLILDCTDSPYSRYLISDVAVLCGLTVVSGSGLKTEGQLSILNFENWGPCYRCFFPTPPPPNSVMSCQDGGVIGPVIGLMGVMMAMEAIKVITGFWNKDTFKPFLSIYSAYDQQSIKTFKMRGRKPQCMACSGTITRAMITSGEVDHAAFCGVVRYDVLNPEERISVEEYHKLIDTDHVLIDVRPKEHFEVVSLPHSISVPLDTLQRVESLDGLFDITKNVFTICRYGNDSQHATRLLNDKFNLKTKDISGGLTMWSTKVDPTLPTY